MKYLDEYRDPETVKKLVTAIKADHYATMEYHGSVRRSDP